MIGHSFEIREEDTKYRIPRIYLVAHMETTLCQCNSIRAFFSVLKAGVRCPLIESFRSAPRQATINCIP